MSVTRLPGTEGKRRIIQSDAVPELDSALSAERGKSCLHKHVAVTVERRVLCKDCEEFIDPVDFILGLARGWDRYADWYRQNQMEARSLAKQVETLKREERLAKDRIKRAVTRGMERGVLSVDESVEIRKRAGVPVTWEEKVSWGRGA